MKPLEFEVEGGGGGGRGTDDFEGNCGGFVVVNRL